jgi:hypothetical protein
MQRMRAAVAENNIYRWAGKILSPLLKIEVQSGELRWVWAEVPTRQTGSLRHVRDT